MAKRSPAAFPAPEFYDIAAATPIQAQNAIEPKHIELFICQRYKATSDLGDLIIFFTFLAGYKIGKN